MRRLLPQTRRGWWALVLGVIVFGGGGTFVWWQDRYLPWYHFRTIVPGALYRAGQPSADDVREAVRDYGVRTVVNLRAERGPWFESEKRAVEEAGALFVDLPLVEGTPPTLEQAEALLALYDDPGRRPILFHCQYGSMRSAGVEALFRVEALGEEPEQALDRTRTFGHDLERKHPAIPAFIRAWVPRRQRTAAPAAPGR